MEDSAEQAINKGIIRSHGDFMRGYIKGSDSPLSLYCEVNQPFEAIAGVA